MIVNSQMESTSPKINLSDFLGQDKNSTIITVFGIFAGLAAYFQQLDHSVLGSLLDMLFIIFLSMTVIVGFDLLGKLLYQPVKKSFSLTILEYLFSLAIGITATYLFLAIKEMNEASAVFLIWILVFALFIKIADGLFKLFRISKKLVSTLVKQDEIRRALTIFGFVVLSAFAFQVAETISSIVLPWFR